MSVQVQAVYHRSICAVIERCGEAILALVAEMGDEDELLASRNTLAALERELLTMAQTLGNLPPPLLHALPLVDWNGWRAIHACLRENRQPRRSEIWYAIRGLVPATLALLQRLRGRQPELFGT